MKGAVGDIQVEDEEHGVIESVCCRGGGSRGSGRVHMRKCVCKVRTHL